MQKYTRNTIQNLQISIKKPCIIFLYGDLWAGKTTLSQHIIGNILGKTQPVTSPTYTYYNKIDDIYHFDLYRISTYDEFISIGWEEILDNNEWVILIEWPEIIEKYYTPDISIRLEKTEREGERNIVIEYVS